MMDQVHPELFNELPSPLKPLVHWPTKLIFKTLKWHQAGVQSNERSGDWGESCAFHVT